MHLGAISTVYMQRTLHEATQRMRVLGLQSIELGAGGFFPKNHCNPAELLADEAALAQFQKTIEESGLTISALTLHGEPLHPDPAVAEAYDREFRAACRLAAKIGVTRFTLLAGLPEAAPGDIAPNWITFPFPFRNLDMYQWQWEKRLIPYWKAHAQIAADHGVRLCYEMVPGDMVYNPETLLRLRDTVGPVVGCNLDPSHLVWQGMDVIEVIHLLGDAIYHVHAKDSRVNERNVRRNGIIDPKSFRDLKNRSWDFCTVGYGHGEAFWRDFVSALRLVGYDDVLSIEHEDPLIDPEEGFELAVNLLQQVVIRKPATKVWFEE
ncbi:MAG: sugar phosphate isomerase/epimerase [Ardenticatenaceae bacterium]|nr:sugar phosphate isomerase/epimerase [Ardenticatenaceae bacterium]HBY99249.1 xylose isomerase [Chloroflexota bacterium]